ncbi:MAG: tRNA uridine-5-carboxymethylaminomethyl(34) synthesis GTPase MnmE [Sphingomonadaceae bacterium]|nr:tRNA uridine-5-carboxymethylaminomethyl(34) synthesis GTPase MnmE [Sphingomonadaceae bacterium]
MGTADTIFALSSGAPPAAIAIIRISGAQAFEAIELLAGRLPAPRRASLVTLRKPSGEELDQALALVFPGPGSATGEDLAELHLHGGRGVVRAVEATLAMIPGLRQAEPGEFTKRAFQNGRIDLNEAEGLADLLAAETEWQRRAANRMMGGAFSALIEKWRVEVLRLSALTEAELDFSDEDDVQAHNSQSISDSCRTLHTAIMEVLNTPSAEKLRDGLHVVLGGPPNSGKSTLLNTLVGRDAAIVSDAPGTTRDRIEVPVAFDGIPLIFIDTAGLRDESHDRIEIIGIERTRAAFDDADILLWLGAENEGPPHPQLIEIEAKSDDPAHLQKSPVAIVVSAMSGGGISDLKAEIVARAKHLLPPPDRFAINRRQRHYLEMVVADLAEVSDSHDWLIIGEHLRQVRMSLDRLTGRAHTEEMLDALFGKFCIGK